MMGRSVNSGPYLSVYLTKDEQALHTAKQTSHITERISITTYPNAHYTRQ